MVFYRQMRVIRRFAAPFPMYPPKYGLCMDFGTL